MDSIAWDAMLCSRVYHSVDTEEPSTIWNRYILLVSDQLIRGDNNAPIQRSTGDDSQQQQFKVNN